MDHVNPRKADNILIYSLGGCLKLAGLVDSLERFLHLPIFAFEMSRWEGKEGESDGRMNCLTSVLVFQCGLAHGAKECSRPFWVWPSAH